MTSTQTPCMRGIVGDLLAANRQFMGRCRGAHRASITASARRSLRDQGKDGYQPGEKRGTVDKIQGNLMVYQPTRSLYAPKVRPRVDAQLVLDATRATCKVSIEIGVPPLV